MVTTRRGVPDRCSEKVQREWKLVGGGEDANGGDIDMGAMGGCRCKEDEDCKGSGTCKGFATHFYGDTLGVCLGNPPAPLCAPMPQPGRVRSFRQRPYRSPQGYSSQPLGNPSKLVGVTVDSSVHAAFLELQGWHTICKLWMCRASSGYFLLFCMWSTTGLSFHFMRCPQTPQPLPVRFQLARTCLRNSFHSLD